jgi:hypothetical protein
MTAFTTHLVVDQLGANGAVRQQEATNTITFADSAGVAVTRVHSVGHVAQPNGPVDVTSDFTFDRRTLALLGMRRAGPMGELVLRADAQHVTLTMPTPAGPRTVTMPATAAAYYAPWADYVVEELPRTLGATYRVKLWQPVPPAPGGAPRVAEETHLYTAARRERVVTLGRTYENAWVVEDRDAGGALRGRMWIVDGPPKLVRWDILAPNGETTRIDQELVGD